MTNTWKCELCGYVHNGEQAPPFCPVCGAGISHFSRFEIRAASLPKQAAEAWRCRICDHIVQGSAAPEFCPICGAAAALFHPYQAIVATTVSDGVRKLVILGAGIAGLTAAEEARRLSDEVQITLVSREKPSLTTGLT